MSYSYITYYDFIFDFFRDTQSNLFQCQLPQLQNIVGIKKMRQRPLYFI